MRRKHSSGENLKFGRKLRKFMGVRSSFHCFLVVSVVQNLSKDDAEESMDQLYL